MNRTILSLLGVFVLVVSPSSNAEDPLKQFQDVQTREYVDEDLGFKLRHPYEWQPGPNPRTTSDFFVGAPFAMPSFWLTIEPKNESSSLEDAFADESLSDFWNYRISSTETIEIAGHQALRKVLKWTTPDAGRHFIRTDVISILTEERHIVIVINQFDRETRWSPRLDEMLESFSLLAKT